MVAWSEVKGLVTELYENPETRIKAVSDSMVYLGAEKVLSAGGVEIVASLATVEGFKGRKEEFKSIVGELKEPEKRPKLVADYAAALGAEKVLSSERIEELAALSTVEGLKSKTGELKEMAAPYIAKVYDSEGRKELVAEATDLASEKVLKPAKELASEKVLKPVSDKVEAVKVASKEYAVEKVDSVKEYATEKVLKPTKELAEPYLAKSTELAAPYIAKMETKRAELVGSKRYEKAVAALQQAREHPMEMASDLRSKAIDLLKYDNLASYRDYIQSEEFQADTMRLVKVELPTIASDAASKGYDQLKSSATTLALEIDSTKGAIAASFERGFSAAKRVELSDLKTKVSLLAVELQAELVSGVEQVKSDGFSLADAIGRLTKMARAIDTILLAPLLAASSDDAVLTTEAPTELAPADLPSSGSPEAEAEEAADEDDTYDDAQEAATPADEPPAEIN